MLEIPLYYPSRKSSSQLSYVRCTFFLDEPESFGLLLVRWLVFIPDELRVDTVDQYFIFCSSSC